MIDKDTLCAMDEFIARCDAAQDDASLRRCFAETSSFPLPVCDLDPLSPGYRDFVTLLYETLAGAPYSIANEYNRLVPAPGAFAEAVDFKYERPYPFCTANPATVAPQLRSVADIISHLPSKQGAKILEMGAGDGFLGECLLRMGYDVSFMEINPVAHNALHRRCKSLGRGKAVCDEFNKVDSYLAGKVDAVIFYESFHHSLDFPQLTDKIKALLADDGSLILAGEPVIKNWRQPWGIRDDAQTIWSVRKHGWMELGFDEDFILELFFAKGLVAAVAPSNLAPIYIFSHLENGFSPVNTRLPSRYEKSFYPPEISANNLPFRHTGPDIILPVPPGASSARIKMKTMNPQSTLVRAEGGSWPKEWRLEPGKDYELELPLAGGAEISLKCTKFVPSQTHKNSDNRELGVVIEWIEYQF